MLGFVLLASLLRFLSSADYAAYSATQVSVGLAGVLAGFGLGPAVVRFLAPGSSQLEGPGWGVAKAAIYLALGFAAFVSAALAAMAPYLSDYFLKSPSGAWVFYFGAAWLFASTVSGLVQSLLQGMRRYSSLAKVLLASRFVAVGVAVAGLVLYQSLAIAVASQVVFGLLVILAVLPVGLGHLRRANPNGHYSKVLSYASPLGLAALVSAVAGNADIVVVGGYLPTGALAVYNATVQISSVLSAFFVSPLITALFAETSLSSESEGEVRIGTGLALRFTLVTLLPASFLAAAMAPQLFGLLSGGGAYSEGIPFLQLITLFYVFTTVQTNAASILQGVGKTRHVLVVGGATAIGEVAIAASLVPQLGLAGAAYSRVTVYVLGCGLALYFVRRYLPTPFDFRFVAKALGSSAIPASAVYLLSVLISNKVVTIAPYSLIGVALFVVSAKTLKLLSAEDKSYLSHLLPASLQWVIRLV